MSELKSEREYVCNRERRVRGMERLGRKIGKERNSEGESV